MLPYTRERTQFGKAIAEFQVGGRLGGWWVQAGGPLPSGEQQLLLG